MCLDVKAKYFCYRIAVSAWLPWFCQLILWRRFSMREIMTIRIRQSGCMQKNHRLSSCTVLQSRTVDECSAYVLMTHNYYYKHESQDNLVYIHCQWLNDVAIEAESDLIICQMSVSDTKAFWSSNGTHNGSRYAYFLYSILSGFIGVSRHERYRST